MAKAKEKEEEQDSKPIEEQVIEFLKERGEDIHNEFFVNLDLARNLGFGSNPWDSNLPVLQNSEFSGVTKTHINRYIRPRAYSWSRRFPNLNVGSERSRPDIASRNEFLNKIHPHLFVAPAMKIENKESKDNAGRTLVYGEAKPIENKWEIWLEGILVTSVPVEDSAPRLEKEQRAIRIATLDGWDEKKIEKFLKDYFGSCK